MKLFFFLFSLSVSFHACIDHAEASPAIAKTVIQCPVADDETEPPDFNSSSCEKLPFWRLDPQQRQIWVKASIKASDALLDSDKPLGVFISAKASSEVFLNGRRLGQNGAPASSKNTEIPGRMDAVFFAPREVLRHGDNDIVIRMSSHHGFLHLNSPVHWIALGEYANPTMLILNVNWPSLIPFGALIAGALYFAATSFSSRFRFDNTMLALISLFAAGQLFAEVYRGLFSYDYPAHDWRMIVVLAFSLGFGFCLIAHIINKYMKQRRFMAFGAVALFTIAAIFLAPGFDGKTALAILTPAIASVGISGFAAYKRQPQAMIHFVALLIFAMTIIIFPDWFLNTLFFYEVAALLLVLFVTQAFAFAKERKQHEDEQMRSQQLASALERARQDNTASQLKITAAGKIDVVRTDEISHCKGAGDYVEICLKNGREILHSGSLAQLEKSLPATFLRVHRSYLVNTDFIRSLTRESSGAGQLLLTTDSEIPVSRRIMPKVRIALG